MSQRKNPDLPVRINAGVLLNAPKPATFNTPSPFGYIEPFLGKRLN